MVKKLLISLISLSGVLLLCACQVIKQSVEKNSKLSTSIQPEAVKVDTTKKNQVLLRPYRDVITAKAITDSGLFIVHKVLERYYFEIPNSLIGRDILTVNRVSKAATEGEQGFFGYGGDQIGENIIQFCKGPNNKLFIRRMFYRVVAKDSSDDGLYRALNNSNLQPIIASFDVKALSPDSSGVVIDATDYINGDNNDVFYFDVQFKKNIQFLGGYQADKSYIAGVKSFPNNVEIQSIKTFIKEGSSSLAFTYELNSSIILLPAVPMKTRLEDERIGYFTRGFVNLDDPKGVDLYGSYMIIRWRLEPKDEDVEKYLKGELVEPKKPIVFFIDPATPKKWVPYLKLGVNDWQKAFEKAGFKNAIYALDAPVADSAWSLSDATHNVIIYKASAVFNAYGPQVSDPRSGEILETHIQWFHNLIQLLQNWYMVQAGAIDARARKMQFDDHLMGQLMRFACAHEVGHTLGLRHNFGASFSVPVDSLRNKQWVEKNGVCPSIMDYARFNYVAQPEDSISENGILPKIGVYDEWAIEWAYRWFPEFKTKEEERAYLNKWVIERTSKDKRLWFGNESQTTDLRCQAEDLGDNAMKAGYYGIQNLKRIFPQLIEWTKLPGTSYNNATISKVFVACF